MEENHQPLSEEIDLNLIKKRSIAGVAALTSRTFFLQIITLVATFLLTVYLNPEQYGVFFVVSAAVNFLVYFSDIGLAAALIQKKEKINNEDLKTTFTIQQILVLTIVFISMIFSGIFAKFYNLSPQGLWLFRSLVFSLFLSSLKTIPSIILERKLLFNRLIIPQIIENVSFYLVAVWLAYKGFGVSSFTWAVLIRGTSGLIAIYLLAPWKPSFGIHRPSAKHLLTFGIPFQLNSFLALLKDDLLTAFVGKILPMWEVGLIGWAQKWAFMPLRFFMDSVNKVTFPAYSRLQHQKQALQKAVEKSIYAVSLIIFPLLTGLALTAPFFVNFIPRYQKWQGALISLNFFAINGLWSSISTTLVNSLNATGHIKTTLKLMVFWTTFTWILTPILIFKFGYNGVAAASAIVASSSFLTIYLTKKIIPLNFLQSIKTPFLSTGAMIIFFVFLSKIINSLPTLFLIILLNGFFYLIFLFIFDKQRLFKEARIIFRSIKEQ